MRFAVLFLVFLLVSVGFVGLVGGQVFWLSGWDYRCSFSVVSDMNDFQGNFSHGLPVVYLDSVRVSEDDGVTLVPVWNESSSVVWCRFPFANQTYYLYWGNDDAIAVWKSTL